jgi:hypothetical protein
VATPPITVATTELRTALALMNTVLGEIGMPLTNSIVAQDQTSVQLLYLMNGLGENLSKFPFWPDLRQEFLITTTVATAYDLPNDWGVSLNGTTWDRSGRWPLIGPKTPTEWQYLQSGFGLAAPQYRWRYFGRQFHLFPVPSVDLTIVQEYLSTHWAVGVTAPGTIADTGKPRITLDTDYILLDERMFIEGAKLAFLEAKGLDSSKAFRTFTDMLEAAWGNANAAPVLSLAPVSENWLLSTNNIPDTGYGT